MKKAVSLFLAAAILFCLGSVSAVSADETPVSISIDTVEAHPGEDVSVSLEIHGNYSATALTLSVLYDPDVLKINGALTRGEVWQDITSSGGMAMSNITNPSMIVFSAITYNYDSFFTASGILFTANFTVSEDAAPGSEIPLELIVTQFTCDEFDGSVIPIAYESESGSINVIGLDSNAMPGDVDCDGSVTMADVTLLSMYLNGESPAISEQGMINADANASGGVNIIDIASIYSIIAAN